MRTGFHITHYTVTASGRRVVCAWLQLFGWVVAHRELELPAAT